MCQAIRSCTSIVMTACAVLVLVLAVTLSWGLQEVCIVPDDGSQNPFIECEITLTLNKFCEDAKNVISDDITVILFDGTHNLSMVCELADVRNVTLKGESESEVAVQCSSPEHSGFRCVNVSTLEISGIELVGCGAALNQPSNLYDEFFAIAIIIGSDLTLTNVTIRDSNFTGFYIGNVSGEVLVESCTFSNLLTGGCIRYVSSATSTRVTVRNSSFLNNKLVHDPFEYSYLSGGLGMYLVHSDLAVDIVDVNFVQNEGHYKGGNMGILCYSSASVSVTDSTFIGGYSNEGGGLYLEESNDFTDFCSVSITNSRFLNNQALFSGGGVYCSNPQLILLLKNISFDGNSCMLDGVALHIKADSVPHRLCTTEGSISISMCSFSNHYPQFELDSNVGAVIAFTSLPYGVEITDITVRSNKYSAILSLETDLLFTGSSRLENNTALKGAGFRLMHSKLYFNPFAELFVTNNTALSTGGGIHIENEFCMITQCFYDWNPERDYNGETVNFTVSNNYAQEGGDNVFGVHRFCFDYPVELVVPPNAVNQPSSVASKPSFVCLDGYQEIGCPEPSNRYYINPNITVYPGGTVTFFLRMVGDKFGAISGTVSANTVGAVAIRDSERVQVVDMLGSNVTYTVYSTQAQNSIETKPYLLLLPVERNCPYFEPTQLQIDIIFRDCPFGFSNTKVTNEASMFGCQCNTSISLLSGCSIEFETITKKLSSSWIGMFQEDSNHTYLAGSKYCPFDYCDSSILSVPTDSDQLNQDIQCQHNRTGILCGSCPKGWSLVLGSSECREDCSNIWLLLILPLALAGLLLVAVIVFLNLTVAMGTVSGLIFYANILQDYSVDLLARHPITGLTPLLQIFLSWLNLDLGISTCFYSGMEAFGKAMLLFVFPTYIWLISALIIFLSHRYIFFTKLVGENAVMVLATLILLSYSKMLRVTIGALNFKFVTVYADLSTLSKVVWAEDGNIPFFDPQKHLALFVLAVIFILLLIPFSMALLCIKHLYSLSNFKVFSWIVKLKPFFDAYTGPFKDRARFWTGLLLFVRVFLLIVLVLEYEDKVTRFYIIVTVCLFLLAIMFTLQGVYESGCLNVLEYFFILNICAFFLTNSHVGEDSHIWKSILSHVLVSSAFLAFLGIVAYHAYLKISCRGLMQKCRSWSRRAEADDGEILHIRDDRDYESLKYGDDSLTFSASF